MTSLVKRHPLVTYVVLAFALFWVLLPLSSISPVLPPIFGTFTPALAAILTRAITEGAPGIQSLFSRLWNWRVGWQWYLVGVGLPILVGFLAIGLADLLGGSAAIPLGSISLASLIVFVFAAGEELGWRGYALPRLLTERSALSASLILGVIHAVWHWPLLLLPGQLLSGNPVLAHTSTIIAGAILYTWIFQHTQGSVLLATLFHGATNAASVLYQGIDPASANWLQGAIWTVIALIVVMTYGTNLMRKPKTTRASNQA